MESEAQWKEVIEFSKQIQTIAENSLKKYYEDAEEMRPHFHSPEMFLHVFKTLLVKKNETTQAKKKATQLASARVKFTAEMVEGMRKDIEKDREEIKVLVVEVQHCTETIVKEKEEAVEVTKRLEEAAEEENEATAAARQLAAECEAELANVMPAIEKALQSLDLIKPKDIAEMKAMKKPPAVVKLVIAAVCVMLQIEPEPRKNEKDELRDLYWGPATKMLGDVQFMRRLQEYDKDNIPDSVMALLRKEFYSHPDFRPERVARASVPAESLCRWILAMEQYDKVSKEILRPKREALAKAQEQLGFTIQSMKKDKKKLTKTEETIEIYETKIAESEEKKKGFEVQIEKKNNAIDRATELIEGLLEEATKWNQLVDQYRASYVTMVGDSVLAAFMVNYMGPLPQEIRDEALTAVAELVANSKEKTKCSELGNFSLHKFVNEPLTLEKWRTLDFPQDPLWLDDATMVTVNCNRQLWPLCVDPLGVVNKWIRNIEQDNSLEICKPGDDNFMEKLKECVIAGKPLLLEDITEALDPKLENVLTRRPGKSSAVDKVMFGEEEVAVSKDFRFYMTTKLRVLKPFFYFKPDEENEKESNFALINFVPPVPESLALQHALLSGVIAREKRKLEAERLATISKVAANRLKFMEIGEKVLQVLSNPEGGRIISIEMTLGLFEARKPLAELQEQMKEDEEAMKKIDSSLDSFRKLTIKLAKRFCSPSEEEMAEPFDIDGFIKRAL